MPENIYILRAMSKWMSKVICVWIVRLLGWYLREERTAYRIVLLMDVLGIHFDPGVIDAAAAVGIDLLFVPASLTWLLQPLDTHVFSLYKRRLRRLFLRRRCGPGIAMPSVRDWLEMIRDTIVLYMNERPWMNAFSDNGFSRDQRGLSVYISSHLPRDFLLPVPSLEPSEHQLRVVFPKTRTKLNVFAFRPKAKPMPMALPASSSHLPLPAPLPVPKHPMLSLTFETSYTASTAKPAMPILSARAKAVAGVKPKAKVAAPKRVRVAQAKRVPPKAPPSI
jgi:hypothetical protein